MRAIWFVLLSACPAKSSRALGPACSDNADCTTSQVCNTASKTCVGGDVLTISLVRGTVGDAYLTNGTLQLEGGPFDQSVRVALDTFVLTVTQSTSSSLTAVMPDDAIAFLQSSQPAEVTLIVSTAGGGTVRVPISIVLPAGAPGPNGATGAPGPAVHYTLNPAHFTATDTQANLTFDRVSFAAGVSLPIRTVRFTASVTSSVADDAYGAGWPAYPLLCNSNEIAIGGSCHSSAEAITMSCPSNGESGGIGVCKVNTTASVNKGWACRAEDDGAAAAVTVTVICMRTTI